MVAFPGGGYYGRSGSPAHYQFPGNKSSIDQPGEEPAVGIRFPAFYFDEDLKEVEKNEKELINQFTYMIELKRISKWVPVGGKPSFILKDINLDIREGEFISIMGPSGSGKSSLLNIIGMLDDASEGEYNFLNQPVHTLKEKQRS